MNLRVVPTPQNRRFCRRILRAFPPMGMTLKKITLYGTTFYNGLREMYCFFLRWRKKITTSRIHNSEFRIFILGVYISKSCLQNRRFVGAGISRGATMRRNGVKPALPAALRSNITSVRHPERSPAEILLVLRLALLRSSTPFHSAQNDTAGRSRTFAEWGTNGAKARGGTPKRDLLWSLADLLYESYFLSAQKKISLLWQDSKTL